VDVFVAGKEERLSGKWGRKKDRRKNSEKRKGRGKEGKEKKAVTRFKSS